MDILQELPIEKWPLLQEKLKNISLNFPGYCSLYLNNKYPKVREAFQFKVYCPDGDMENGFVGLTTIGDQACIMFSISEDTSKLEEAICKTKRIEWSKKVYFDLLTSRTVQALDRIISQMYFENYKKNTYKMFLLDGTTDCFPDFKTPENTYLSTIKQEDIQYVDNSWPYKHQSSHYYFTTLATNGLSYGLYSSDTHELLAWVFINEYCFLCHLYCKEAYRRRGYAEYIMKSAVNDLLTDGSDVYAYVAYGNDKPLSLFKRLGFKHVDESAFAFVQKTPENTYLSTIKQEDIQYVDNSWPYKHQSSHYYFTTLATNGLSYGLYSSDTHELLAWVFINEYCFLCHLYCKEAYRRRGYAEYIMKSAVNDLLTDGSDVYAYVAYGNDKPLSLFKRLGFKHVDESAFAFVQK